MVYVLPMVNKKSIEAIRRLSAIEYAYSDTKMRVLGQSFEHFSTLEPIDNGN